MHPSRQGIFPPETRSGLGIAKALIHRPRVLILDEPANGLDPEGIIEVRELLQGLAKDFGVTILVSSHRLDEISRHGYKYRYYPSGKAD
jgi:ABC-2 type transport system ATP-binding protein